VSVAGLSGVSAAKKPRSNTHSNSSNAHSNSQSDFTAIGVNRFDFDGGGLDVYAERTRSPDRPGSATHVYSNGQTEDYISVVANVTGGTFTLGDFTGDMPTSVTYDYYVSDTNTNPAPDEVWLRLVQSDGTKRTVYRHATDPNAGPTWKTRDVTGDINGTSALSTGFTWHTLQKNLGTRDLTSVFDADTRITRLGAGYGTTGHPKVLDAYFADLKADNRRLATFPTGHGP